MAKNASIFFIVTLAFVFTLFSLGFCYADTVYLKGSGVAVPLKVNKATEKYIVATIQKRYVNNINIRPDRYTAFPDTVYFGNHSRNGTRCKIIDITDNIYAVKLSMSDIESLEINAKNYGDRDDVTFPGDRYLNNTSPQASSPYGGDLRDLELAEEMEFNDINAENRIEEPETLIRGPLPEDDFDYNDSRLERPADNFDPEALKDQIKKELMEAMNKQEEKEEKQFLLENTGKVSGKIFRNGKPYPNCKVQIVSLTKERVLFFKSVKRGEQLETVTDENGMYYFKDVDPGSYKIFWKPHYETSWIRRFNMKPDIIVTAGKTTFPKTLEISKRVMN